TSPGSCTRTPSPSDQHHPAEPGADLQDVRGARFAADPARLRTAQGGAVIPRLLALSPSIRWRLAGLVLLLLSITATYVGQGVLVAQALARIFAGRDAGSIVWLVAGVVVLQLARSVALAVRESVALRTSAAVKAELRRRLTGKLLRLGPAHAQRGRTGSSQTTLVDGIETADAYIGRFLPQ